MKSSRFVLLAALLLSGCFRPAGDSIQPTSDFTAAAVENPGATATPGAPPITLISPTDNLGITTLPPTDDLPLAALTEITLAPPTATFTATEVPSEPTATLQIITPGISLDLLTPDTPTALPPAETLESFAPVTEEALDNATPVEGARLHLYRRRGDNLYRIAVEYNTTVPELQAANPDLVGDPPILQIGDMLKLPNCEPGSVSATPVPGEGSTIEAPPGGEVTLFSQAICLARLPHATASASARSCKLTT